VVVELFSQSWMTVVVMTPMADMSQMAGMTQMTGFGSMRSMLLTGPSPSMSLTGPHRHLQKDFAQSCIFILVQAFNLDLGCVFILGKNSQHQCFGQ